MDSKVKEQILAVRDTGLTNMFASSSHARNNAINHTTSTTVTALKFV